MKYTGKENFWYSSLVFSMVGGRKRKFRQALRYIIPQRLTLSHNPRIHAWLWWNF